MVPVPDVDAVLPVAGGGSVTRSMWGRNVALVAPLVLVNAAAVYGQAGWAYDHLGHSAVIAVLFAAAVESIGVYLAGEAHAALLAGDASARLRLGSYLVGVLVGCLNYGHFAGADFAPNPLALTFGLLSSVSPWLWAIRSRSLHRDRLRELGQIDPRAVRFSLLRWVLYPLRTFRTFRYAVWAGIVQPAEAVTAADRAYAARRSTGAELAPVVAVQSDGEPSKVAQAPSPRRRKASATRRPVEETRKLVAQLRTELPDASHAEIARRLGISATRLRQVEQRSVPEDGPADGVAMSALVESVN